MKKFLLLILYIISLENYSQEYVMATDIRQPFILEKQNNSLNGIDIEILKLISTNLNLSLITQKKSLLKCLQDMKSGSIDLMMGLSYSDEKAEYISYLDQPYISVSPAFFTKQTDIKIEQYDDLKHYKIGYINGLSYFPEFDQDKDLIKIPAAHETQLLEMLYNGSIDIILGTDIRIKYELQEKELTDTIVEIKYKPDYIIDLYIGISKKSDFIEYKDEVENIIDKIKINGELNSIITNYTN